MRTEQTIFSAGWIGTDLPNRPIKTTYARFGYSELLSPEGINFDGTFSWLRDEPRKHESIFEPQAYDGAANFKQLATSASLPREFLTFFQQPELAQRIRSCTSCYLDLTTKVVPAPKGEGSIARFLVDQQGCVFWYLFIAAEGSDHAVLASPDFFGVEHTSTGLARSDPDSILFVASSFERFIFRFWLENEYWYTSHGFGPPSPAASRFLAEYGWKP